MGFDTQDDAGVYRLNDEIALVTTADFITPPVDDGHLFGQVAAANALSDIYAMGGRPLTCINLAAFPSKKLAPEILQDIVAGALSKITEAGAVLAGGHTVEDAEPKFGLSVVGIVHPDHIWTNAGARPGDCLILTKPIGSGVLFNANLKGWVSAQAMKDCLEILVRLNRTAAEVMAPFEIHAVTDVTGFGLAGHSFEVASGSDVCLRIDVAALPIMDQALDMYQRGMNTGANRPNRQMVKGHFRLEQQLPSWHEEILFDPQTSGGLLVALPHQQGPNLVQALHDAGVKEAAIIGTATKPDGQMRLIFA